ADCYDVIIFDLATTPDGFGQLRDWRGRGLSTPVLALVCGLRNRVRSLDEGADDCMDHPPRFEELLARVRTLIRRGHCMKDPVLRVHDLVIDTITHTVKRAGRVIPLTPREYTLLELLAYRQGRVVGRSVIWEHLYDDHEEETSNVVDVYIR